MIKNAIKKYSETQNRLGQGADNMEIGSVSRVEFISAMKGSLLNQEIEVATWLHDNYEEIAKSKNWNTQDSCKVEFDSLPEENKKVMLEMAKRILSN